MANILKNQVFRVTHFKHSRIFPRLEAHLNRKCVCFNNLEFDLILCIGFLETFSRLLKIGCLEDYVESYSCLIV